MSYFAVKPASLLLTCISIVTCWRPALAQTAVPASNAVARVHDAARLVRARRLTAAIVVDGRIDDVAWKSAELASDFVQQRPNPGAPSSQRSEARVLFDAQALYVSMRLLDEHPDSLLAPLARRDYEGYGDWAHVIIDSYHDRRTGFHFAVNPAGTRRDAMISNDAEWQEDASWDAVWDVATSRDSSGWTAEFRIPLTQLRFDRCGSAKPNVLMMDRPNDATAQVGSQCAWGIQFMRDLARRNERSVWAPMPPDASGYVSRFGSLAGLDGIQSPRRIELVPYSLARAARAPLDRTNPFYERTALGGAFGADIGLGLTSKLTLTATINPDFGQVEADPSEVNLTGAETFLRERRPFFVEGSNIFNYPLGDGLMGEEQLFYSRRIGRAPQIDDPDDAAAVDRPDATSIIGAGKLSGKVGSWTVGVLDAVTGSERAQFAATNGTRGSFIAEPMTNYAFARLARDGADGRNSLGLVASAVHRDLDPNAAATLRSSALATGVDGRLRTRNRDYTFGANLLASYVRGSSAAITETQRSFTHLLQRPGRGSLLDTTRTSLVGWSTEIRAMKQGGGHWRWGVNGRAVTSGFEVNDLGFQLRSDVASTANWVGYTHFQPGRVIRQWEIWGNYWGRWTFDGAREQLAANLWSNVQFQNGWMLMSEARREFSRMSPTLLRGGPATYVPPNVLWWSRLVSDPRRLVSGELMTQGYVDDVGGGYRAGVFPLITVRPSARAELSVQPGVMRVRNPAQYVDVASVAGDTSYVTGALSQTTASLTARVNVTFTPTLSFQLYAQPFLSAGDYTALGEVRDARAKRLTRRIATFAPASVSPVGDDALRIDRGAGRTPIELDDPDFTVRELKSNAVLRWEYRPGSAVFLVWAQARDNDDRARFSLSRQAKDLWRTPGTNVLLIKASYWITP